LEDYEIEAVDDVIIREWRAAGTPDNWNVSPMAGAASASAQAVSLYPKKAEG
jgi:hypothetical protein